MGAAIVNPADCPSGEPTQNASCPRDNLVCRYGDDLQCRSYWACAPACTPVCTPDLVWQQGLAKRDCPGSCPAAEPHEGDPCTGTKTLCTYGSDPTCRSEWECFENKWAPIVPHRACGATYCPAEPPVFPNFSTSCTLAQVTPNGQACVYQFGTNCLCVCTYDPTTGITQMGWSCSIPYATFTPADFSCPLDVPVGGTACQHTGACTYRGANSCSGPPTVISASCTAGQWQVTGQ